MFTRGRWVNEPSRWSVDEDGLQVTTDASTDFWRVTSYGFVRHSGHFYAQEVAQGFTAALRIRARYEQLYDQAGLMVLVDEANWAKAGIEMSDGQAQLGSVLTRELSDWATAAFQGDASDIWMRMTVEAGVLRIQWSRDGLLWPLIRLAPLPAADRYLVGPMCCTPERAGLEVLFSDFSISPPNRKPLHDLS